MGDLPEAKVLGPYSWRWLLKAIMKSAIFGSLAVVCWVVGATLVVLCEDACDTTSHAELTKGQAMAQSALVYGIATHDCWGDDKGWECVHVDETWSVCVHGKCTHLKPSIDAGQHVIQENDKKIKELEAKKLQVLESK